MSTVPKNPASRRVLRNIVGVIAIVLFSYVAVYLSLVKAELPRSTAEYGPWKRHAEYRFGGETAKAVFSP